MTDKKKELKPLPYRPGLEGVTAGISSISYIDEAKERLIYRGYNIDDLAANCIYEEVAYLLLYGKLPNKSELKKFNEEIASQRLIAKEVLDMLKKFPKKTHPMDALRNGVALVSMYDPDVDNNSHEGNLRKAKRLIAKIPTIITSSYRIMHGKEPVTPNPEFSHAENLLYMLHGKKPEQLETKIMNTSLILYAEHGFNASTFSGRVTVSTLSDYHSAIIAAIGTLKGPLHGGANEKAMEMMLKVKDPKKAEEWVMEALVRKEKIMGFGHRIYKHGDSRYETMKQQGKELGEIKGITKWYEIADIIEKVMMREKSIFPNVDFSSAFVYYLLGLPIKLYTPLFAASRIAGWSAHVIEQLDDNKLMRPDCDYTGEKNLKFVDLKDRK